MGRSKKKRNNIKLKNNIMYNRKFDIKKDFSKLNELENTIIPLIDKMDYQDALDDSQSEEKRDLLKNYVREIFNNQFKK